MLIQCLIKVAEKRADYNIIMSFISAGIFRGKSRISSQVLEFFKIEFF